MKRPCETSMSVSAVLIILLLSIEMSWAQDSPLRDLTQSVLQTLPEKTTSLDKADIPLPEEMPQPYSNTAPLVGPPSQAIIQPRVHQVQSVYSFASGDYVFVARQAGHEYQLLLRHASSGQYEKIPLPEASHVVDGATCGSTLYFLLEVFTSPFLEDQGPGKMPEFLSPKSTVEVRSLTLPEGEMKTLEGIVATGPDGITCDAKSLYLLSPSGDAASGVCQLRQIDREAGLLVIERTLQVEGQVCPDTVASDGKGYVYYMTKANDRGLLWRYSLATSESQEILGLAGLSQAIFDAETDTLYGIVSHISKDLQTVNTIDVFKAPLSRPREMAYMKTGITWACNITLDKSAKVLIGKGLTATASPKELQDKNLPVEVFYRLW